MNIRTVKLDEELFHFETFQQLVDKAQSWFDGHSKFLCLDEDGRVCLTGSEFMRARDENKFPIRVYSMILPKEMKHNG